MTAAVEGKNGIEDYEGEEEDDLQVETKMTKVVVC
jgi:hypothetical protein